jgi:hypothetical protein
MVIAWDSIFFVLGPTECHVHILMISRMILFRIDEDGLLNPNSHERRDIESFSPMLLICLNPLVI